MYHTSGGNMQERIQSKLKLYSDVYRYLVKRNMGFCFLPNGQLISVNDCINFLAENHLSMYDKIV